VTAPLHGIRVLDLSRLLPGPMCSLYLADLGADVVKVEDTGAGDYARTLGTSAGTQSALFRAINRGKRSIAIDLKSAAGREAFDALVRGADVVLESFRPGVARSLRVDYATLAPLRPQLVYCSLSGYGQDGPRARMAGHDVNYLGYAGVLDATGPRAGAPVVPSVQIADLLGGAASAAIAILASLVGARIRGEGRFVDVAMADATLAHAVFALLALEERGSPAARGDDLLTGGVPCYGVYATADDRFVSVGALEEKFWAALCAALDRRDLLGGQFDGSGATRAALEAVFAAAPRDAWVERLAGVDCCVTPVLDFAEALGDAQFRARGMVHRRGDGTTELAPPFRLSSHAFVADRAAPAQGEHTRDLLREAGYDDARIAALAATGAIRTAD